MILGGDHVRLKWKNEELALFLTFHFSEIVA